MRYTLSSFAVLLIALASCSTERETTTVSNNNLSDTIARIELIDDQITEEASTYQFSPKANEYLQARISEFDQIPAERKGQLEELGIWLAEQRSKQDTIKLTFICTHNSRRSILAQVWARAAADYFGINPIKVYSGGTEATASHPSARGALLNAGLTIRFYGGKDPNPIYSIQPSLNGPSVLVFSKAYTDSPNPTTGFAAVMTCSQADEACPVVEGASQRFKITYEDPKVADGTPNETQVYEERSAQIAREMLYAFSLALGSK